MKLDCNFFHLTILLCASFGFVYTETGVRWVDLEHPNELFLKQLIPSAVYIGGYSIGFLCRGFTGNMNGVDQYLPGTLWLVNNVIVECRVPTGTSTTIEKEFQVLEGRPGTTSWVRYNDELPGCAVQGGNVGDDNEPVYVCRGQLAEDKEYLIGYWTSDGCKLPTEPTPQIANEKIEILCLNLFGYIQ